jgi:starch synthase
MARVRVLAAASEVYPLVKTGGLADVAGALPKALAAENVAVTTLVPGYPAVLKALASPSTALSLKDFFGGSARVLSASTAGLDLFVLDAPHLFARAGNPYTGPNGRDWPDNALRFAAFARAAAHIASGALPGYRPDVVHAHDWQAGLVPAYLHYAGATGPPSVVTVHNLAFQGLFPRELLPALGLPPEAYSVDGVEYYGNVGFLKAGLQFADRITTVSPTYAMEITTAQDGMGLDGLLRKRAAVLSGILNGIDVDVWNPATDPHLAANYDAEHIAARAANTAALQTRLGLNVDPDALCIGVVSRLTEQKGLDLLIDALRHLLGTGAQLALLGAGDAALERTFSGAAKANPGRIGVVIGYDESLAHQIQAGASALLVPSRFEPCGLTQLCALRYGAVPVVARVGGLADTIVDANEMALSAGVATGIQFAPPATGMLEHALSRTAALFRDRAAWARMQANGMRADVSWGRPAHRYANLYRELVGSRASR